ncbi:MAG: YIP1 family protein [Salinisphaera sp.]|nr:YIP1 family protein [Nevskiaceae bacterium]MDN5938205.1 YIP1 family protein [Salinisphaera sp.]
MIGAAKLQPAIYEEVEADKGALGQAAGVVVLAAIAAGIGVLGGGFGLFIGTIIAALVGWVVWAVITWVIGTKLLPEPQTEADIAQMLRTIGFSASPGLLRVFGIIPVIGWLVVIIANIWMLIAMIIGVRQALDYKSTGRAVAVCIIGFIVEIIIMAVIFSLLGPDVASMPAGNPGPI